MRAVASLLADLTTRDIRLWVDDGRLRFNAPQGAMTADLRQELKVRKSELVEVLAADAAGGAGAPAIVADPVNAGAPFPLTPIQQAYWVGRGNAESFELGGVSAHVYFELDGQGLDIARLEWAWNVLVRRHPMLRAVVDADGMQRILADVPHYAVALTDLSTASTEQIDAHIETLRAELSHRVAPAERWPLFDIRATALGVDRLRLHIGFDGLTFDASSILLLAREAWTLYATGRDTLAPLALTFRDYVLAEARLRQSDEYRRARDYWEARLDSLPAAPDLPLAMAPAALGTPRFVRRSCRLDPAAWSVLKTHARAAGLTPSALLLAGFADIVALWAREPRFTINLSLFNRQPLHPQVDTVVGDFTTLMLLEVDATPARFLDRARAIQSRLWQDMDHKAVSGVEVLGWLGRRGAAGRAMMPIVFTSALSLDALEGDAHDLNPFGTIVYGITQTPQVLLDVLVIEHGGALHYAWDAVEAAFPPGMLDAMFAAYGALVGKLAAEDDALTKLGRFELASPAPPPPERPVSDDLLHTGFFRRAVEKPEASAVLSTRRSLSYGQLLGIVAATVAALARHAIDVGEPVAVVMEKGWEQIAAVLAISVAGGAYVPIEADWPPARRNAILERIGARVALVQPHRERDLALPAGVAALGIADHVSNGTAAIPPSRARPDDLAYVIFTSGSTGEPKGVMITHRAAINTIEDLNARRQIGPRDRVLALSALGFDLSVYDTFGLLGAGGAVVVPDAGSERDPGHWLDLMRAHGVTVWNSVPALIAMLAEYLSAESEPAGVPLSLAMLSGDWIPLGLPDAVRRCFPACCVVSLGGATEAAIWSIEYPVEAIDPAWTSIPYGRPLANQDVRVLDHDLSPRPPWTVGELFIAGNGVAQGYWGNPELTAQRFLRHPRTGERLYRTGDLGRYRPDGVIEFLGREDRQVKIGGFRIELGEIEAVLKRQPGVADAVVEAVGPDRADRRLVAYLVWEGPALPATAALARHDVEGLAYKRSRPGLRKDTDKRPTVALPSSGDSDARLAALLARQSFREFLDRPVALADLARLLEGMCSQPIAGAPVPKLMYPSGGALYPVQLYVNVKPGRVEGLAAGLYYLDPDGRALCRIHDQPAPETIHGDYNRAFAAASAFDLLLVANPDVVGALYPDLARDFCLLEAGAISQLLRERAPDAGLGLCAVGSIAFEPVREALGLSAGAIFLHGLIGGPIAPEQTQRWGMVELPPRRPADTAILAHAARHLPAYMVPRQVVWLDRLPLSANGKIDRRALPAPASSAITIAVAADPEVAPSGFSARADGQQLDDVVAACVEQVLGHTAVDRTRNLFDLGADSLKVIQIRNRIVGATNRSVNVLDFFRYPTVSLLAERLRTGIGSSTR